MQLTGIGKGIVRAGPPLSLFNLRLLSPPLKVGFAFTVGGHDECDNTAVGKSILVETSLFTALVVVVFFFTFSSCVFRFSFNDLYECDTALTRRGHLPTWLPGDLTINHDIMKTKVHTLAHDMNRGLQSSSFVYPFSDPRY